MLTGELTGQNRSTAKEEKERNAKNGVRMKTAKRVKLLPGEVTEISLIQEEKEEIKESEYVF